nr:CFI-box-CTERM domain-containing protein [uncultured Caproiciproducens sp.]
MKYISAVCPHCKKELQLPDDAENIVCMYCAQPIHVKTLLAEMDMDKPNDDDYRRLMDEATALLNDAIFTVTNAFKNVKQDIYPEEFQNYNKIISPALKSYCLAAAGNDEAPDFFAGLLFDRFQKQIELMGIKKESDPRLFEYRYMIVAFTVPAILEQHTPAAEALADSFLKVWNAHYPKNPLGKSNYDAISNGFRKKLCFITTAVCSSLGKGDNCEELEAFRKFRDGWLQNSPGGKAKICEYYLFAPLIVSKINQSDNQRAVYKEIWENHLFPCLTSLENENPLKCAEQYEDMILELEQKWLN